MHHVYRYAVLIILPSCKLVSFEEFTRCKYWNSAGPLGSIQAGQLYIAGSMGRYFTCVHVTLLVPKGVHFQEARTSHRTCLT